MSISLWILDDCRRPFEFVYNHLPRTSSKVIGGTFHVDELGSTGKSFSHTRNMHSRVHFIDKLFNIERDFSTNCHEMCTWIMKCLEPPTIASSVLEINSVGLRWYTGSTTNAPWYPTIVEKMCLCDPPCHS
ncbi:hypothetical protein GOBAR_AA31120 [Gossypium barbadense]|uniref:Uncharacterized protein n=1 Tax=Gossypium barbadense TaxID=3634 RepID=A0A2P5WEN3_GOSBA|nr:hypothetical protein GOBAR_AA31120 [Gossypium barbadense]